MYFFNVSETKKTKKQQKTYILTGDKNSMNDYDYFVSIHLHDPFLLALFRYGIAQNQINTHPLHGKEIQTKQKLYMHPLVIYTVNLI